MHAHIGRLSCEQHPVPCEDVGRFAGSCPKKRFKKFSSRDTRAGGGGRRIGCWVELRRIRREGRRRRRRGRRSSSQKIRLDVTCCMYSCFCMTVSFQPEDSSAKRQGPCGIFAVIYLVRVAGSKERIAVRRPEASCLGEIPDGLAPLALSKRMHPTSGACRGRGKGRGLN